MKKTLLFLSALGLTALTALPSSRPISVSAEGEEDTSLVSEAVSSAQEEASSSFNIDQIVIDGKTLEQWKKELKDNNTRNAAILALVPSVVLAVLYIIKWLADRNMLKKVNAVSSLANLNTEDVKKLVAEYDEKLKGYEKQLEQYVESSKKLYGDAKDALNAKIDRAEALLIEEKKKADSVMKALMEIAKNDPDQISAGTYRRIKDILEVSDDGE